jgi:hypothetical protein
VTNKNDEPVITYYEHEKDGKSYICLADNCPLCEIGDEPKHTALINVINLSDHGHPKVVVRYAIPGPGGDVLLPGS